jgi:hypothetical protein
MSVPLSDLLIAFDIVIEYLKEKKDISTSIILENYRLIEETEIKIICC